MTNKQRARILTKHSFISVFIGQALYALEHWTYRQDDGSLRHTHEWVCVSGMDREDLLNWLGY